MDPGARAALIVGLVAGLAVLATAAFVAPLAPLLAVIAGPLAGWSFARFTRRERPARAGLGGVIALPPIVVGQGLGTALNLLVLGGGVRLGARLTMVGDGGARDELMLPGTMVVALIALAVLLAAGIVLAGAAWAERRTGGRAPDSAG